MKQVLSAALEVQQFFEQNDWPFCFIGGVALLAWSDPRLTNDADVVLFTGFGEETRFIEKILARFRSRIPDAEDFAKRTRILLLEVGGVGIDVSLGALPFEESAVRRSVVFRFLDDVELRICNVEDLIVFKAFAARLRDWADIENIIATTASIDWSYVTEQLEPLVELKEEPAILKKLEELRNRTEA